MTNDEEIKYDLEISDPANTSIILSNTGTQTVEFQLKINNKIFYSESDLVNYIQNFDPVNHKKPLYWKAWDFVVKNTYHHIPVSEDRWYHSPLLFINSFGFGLCDDMNVFLANLWRMCGYQSRVLHLCDHIVPELLTDSEWKMLDGDFGTYYLMPDKRIASIDDIQKNASSISLQVNENGLYGKLINYLDLSKTVDHLYLKNSYVEGWYDKYPEFIPGNFMIPPGGYLEFPGIFKERITIFKVGKLNNIALARLFIPKGFKGDLAQPLHIAGIHGRGTIKLYNKHKKIRKGNENLIQKNNITNILNVSSSKSDINIFYFINPNIFRLEKNIELLISGCDHRKIALEVNKLRDESVITYNSDLMEQILYIIQNSDKYELQNSSKIQNIKLIQKKLKLRLNDFKLNCHRKKMIIKRLEYFFSNRSEDQIRIFVKLMNNRHFIDTLINSHY